MRRTISAAAVALVLAGVAPAGAAPARTAGAPYDFDATKPGASGWFGANYGVFFGDAVVLETRAKERSVALTVADAGGEAVSAAAWQEGGEAIVFCSESGRLPIAGGEPLYVQVIVDATPQEPGGCETPAVPTTGTVSATFRRK
ncbi:MAG TPA: hypothetical protein VHJ76_00625 [Actinomycetota bacterium]|nr:hypothetical protein [Actinomycetota bacterium]